MKTFTMISVVVLALHLFAALSSGSFSDTFDGPNLDPRWTADNSPTNTNPSSNFQIVNGQAVATNCHANCYDHLETPIYGNCNFTVQVDCQINTGCSWGGILAIYWDEGHYITLKAPSCNNFYVESWDGSSANPKLTVSTKYYGGGKLATMKIVFDANAIKFYAMNQGDSGFTYLSNCDLARTDAFMGADALMVIGKGHQDWNYYNPDYNNDYSDPGLVNESIILDNASYQTSATYFVDTFGNSTFDPRWTMDKSPNNTGAGSTFFLSGGEAWANNVYANSYDHIETPIDATGNFVISTDQRVNLGSTWGGVLSIYWDTTHFITLKEPAGGYFQSQVYNGTTFTGTNSTVSYPGWDLENMRIKFGPNKIKFYANNTYLSGLDLPRSAWTKAAGAKLIIGKGHEDASYTNPDYDNDSATLGSQTDAVEIDNVRYEPYTAYPEAVKVWSIDPYQSFKKNRAAGAGEPNISSLSVNMAQGEYRDAVLMIGPCDDQLTLAVTIGPNSLPNNNVILIEETLYTLNKGHDWTGDAVYPLTSNLVIPDGESRQLRLRFDSRYSNIQPGTYTFNLVLTPQNTSNSSTVTIPGTLTVWNFALPSSNVLRNNSYANFVISQFGGGLQLTNAVKEMKRNGFNTIYIQNSEMPKVTSINDANGHILGFNTSTFDYWVSNALSAWNQVSGGEPLQWVFQVDKASWLPAGSSITFPNDPWTAAFKEYVSRVIGHLVDVNGCNISDYANYTVTTLDEPSATDVMNIVIPCFEAIRQVNSKVRTTTNCSYVLTDPTWTTRYYNATDLFQPDEWNVINDGNLVPYLKASNKEIHIYDCEAYKNLMNAPLYSYYRGQQWYREYYGLGGGIGLWTYCALEMMDPFSSTYIGDATINSGWKLIYQRAPGDSNIARSRRCEMFRETADDYRYLAKLRDVAAQIDGNTVNQMNAYISQAAADVINNISDTSRCETWRQSIAAKILALQGPTAYFTDTFDGPKLNARWTKDNSSNNTDPNSFIAISNGVAWGNNVFANSYDHLETPIDANGVFVVQADERVNVGSSWGAVLSVYWDTTHFVTLKAPVGGYFSSQVYDGTTYTNTNSNLVYPGWGFATLKISFGADKIRFFAKNSDDSSFTYLSSLDITRGDVFKQRNAILIVGKGHEDNNYTNPDYDNDYASLGSQTDCIGIDNVSFRSPYFQDSFNGPNLDPRWTKDNSPNNTNPSSNIAISNGVAWGNNVYANSYDHLETPIDGSGNFTVQADERVNVGNSWGAVLSVYWDTTHFVTLKAPVGGYFASQVYNGTTYTNTNSNVTYSGWGFATLKMVFHANTIEFDVNTGSGLTHLTSLDISRGDIFKQPNALLIIGKGYEDNSYTNPDYDNDYVNLGSQTDCIGIDNASFTMIVAAAPGQATNPNPANSAAHVSISPTVTWTAGSNTTSHDVYFGTNQTNVTNADHTYVEFKGNQPGTTYSPATLTGKITYYWRVDEVGDGGTTKGVVWSFTTDVYTEKFQDITVSTAGAWTSVALSSFGVLPGQVVEIGLRNSNTSTARLAGVRINGSSINRYITLRPAASAGWDTAVMQVKTDASATIQAYAANTTDVHIILLGVWDTGNYTEAFQALTISTTGAWTATADLSTYGVAANQVVEILAANTSTSTYVAGIRATNSSLTRSVTLGASTSSANECVVMEAQSDSTRKVQVWKGNTAVSFYLLGYWTTAPGTYNEKFVDVGKPSSSATWTSRSLSGQSVPANAVCEFLIANGSTANSDNVGVRMTGSVLSRLNNQHKTSASSTVNCGEMHVEADSSSNIYQYLQSSGDSVNFYLLGYWN